MAESFDSIMTEAGNRNVRITLKPDGSLGIRWPRGVDNKPKKDAAFLNRIQKNSALLKVGLGAPDSLSKRVKDARQDNVFERFNQTLNGLRDKYMARPMAEAAGAIAPYTWLGYTPKPKELGQAIGADVAQGLVPDTLSGKAAVASTLINPEFPEEEGLATEASGLLKKAPGLLKRTLSSPHLRRMMIPTAAGAVAGGLSGEGTIPGAIQGFGVGAAGELTSIPGAVKNAKKTMGRMEAARMQDDILPGEKLSPVLKLKSFDQLRQRYGNWVRALRDLRTGREAGQRFGEKWDDIMMAIRDESLAKGRAIQKRFEDTLKVPFDPKKGQYSDAIWSQYHAARQEAAEAVSDGRRLINAMRKARALGRKAFKPDGGMKPSEAAHQAADELFSLKDQIKSKLSSEYPKLGAAYSENNDEYAMFKSLRDLVDRIGITGDGKHVDLNAIMTEMDDGPVGRKLQGRMKENWDGVKNLMRRDAPVQEGFDQPGALSKMRAILYGTKAHAATTVGTAADIVGGAPLIDKPVGNVAGVQPRSSARPPTIPRLITGAMANEGEEKLRGTEP